MQTDEAKSEEKGEVRVDMRLMKSDVRNYWTLVWR